MIFHLKRLSLFLKSINMKNIGIYVHFPFCHSKCKYCNFNSSADCNHLQMDYFQALLREIRMYSSPKINVDTIFIGGGTPSIMFDGCITTLLSEIRKSFVVDSDVEITIEANPNSVTVTKAQEWKDAGVNRVSIGLQTSNPNVLKLIGRTHTTKDYINAVEIVRNAGISNINTDILVGLPRQKMSHLKHTLKLLTKMQCSHISVYSLILEENTPLYNMVVNNEVKLPKEEKAVTMYNYAYMYLKDNGFTRYEVSNFAKYGYECKHNLHTWQMRGYLGFGAGAHSYYKDIRYNNFDNINMYIDKINNDEKPVESKEKISIEETIEEYIMLGLRTKYGIDTDEIKEKYKIDLLKNKKETINKLLSQGLINLVYNKIIATDRGMQVLNQIILDLVI